MKLEWQENPPTNRMNWNEALDYSKSFGEGWRLPMKYELINKNLYYDNQNNKPKGYWHQTSIRFAIELSYGIGFLASRKNQDYLGYVFCVREVN